MSQGSQVCEMRSLTHAGDHWLRGLERIIRLRRMNNKDDKKTIKTNISPDRDTHSSLADIELCFG